MDIYIPNKNTFGDCLYLIAIAKLLSNKLHGKVFITKGMKFHNTIRNYTYTHIFHNYFQLKTCKYISEDDDSLLSNYYNNFEIREKIFKQQITYPNRVFLNIKHLPYVKERNPNFVLNYPKSLLLLALSKEVLEFYRPNVDIYPDRIGVYIHFNEYDIEPSINNDKVLKFLTNVTNSKLFIATDNKIKLPYIDKSNDVILYENNIHQFITNGDSSSNEEMLLNTYIAAYQVCSCKEIYYTEDITNLLLMLLFIRKKL